MNDVRTAIRESAPGVDELDMDEVRRRAARMRVAQQQRARRVVVGVAASMCVVVLGLSIASVVSPPSPDVSVGATPTAGPVAIAPPADSLRGTTLDGGELAIADFPGEPLILYAFADWCGPCQDDLALLAATDLEVRTIGLAVDADEDGSRIALADAGLALPTMLLNWDQLAMSVTPIEALPVWFALNAEHEVVDTIAGAIGGELRLRTLAETALTRTEPSNAVTMAPEAPPATSSPVGCPVGPVEERTYVVQPGDSLSGIARTVYGDPLLFGIIADANGITDTSPLQVGQTLVIPPCEASQDPGVATGAALDTTLARLRATLDPEVAQALVAGLPDTYSELPTADPSAVAFGTADLTLLVHQLDLLPGMTAEQVIADALAAGSGTVDLDGVPAAFTNPAATGQLLVPLPGNRVIVLSPEEGRAIDYEINVLQQWMVVVRLQLG